MEPKGRVEAWCDRHRILLIDLGVVHLAVSAYYGYAWEIMCESGRSGCLFASAFIGALVGAVGGFFAFLALIAIAMVAWNGVVLHIQWYRENFPRRPKP